MKKNFDIRLAALREYLRLLSADETVFIVEGGGEFRTAEDAFTYLRKYGAVTHCALSPSCRGHRPVKPVALSDD